MNEGTANEEVKEGKKPGWRREHRRSVGKNRGNLVTILDYLLW